MGWTSKLEVAISTGWSSPISTPSPSQASPSPSASSRCHSSDDVPVRGVRRGGGGGAEGGGVNWSTYSGYKINSGQKLLV